MAGGNIQGEPLTDVSVAAAAGLHPALTQLLRRHGLPTIGQPGVGGGWTGFLSDLDTVFRTSAGRVVTGAAWPGEADLSGQAAFHHAILENAAEAIIATDDRGIIHSFNAAAERMYGWVSLDIIGRHWSVLCPPAATDALDGAQDGTRLEFTGVRKDGTGFPVQASIATYGVHGRNMVTIIVRDVSDSKALEQALIHQAGHDSLTGLPNRALFGGILGEALLACTSAGTEIGVLFCDLNKFKIINDSLGHEIGDQVLVEAANRFRKAVRVTDVVARLSGDEFVILCTPIDGLHDAQAIAARIHRTFDGPFTVGNHSLTVGTSVGIATGGAGEPENLIRNADLAMYRAKRDGPGRTGVYDTEMHTWVARRHDVETALRQALRRGELRVHYQPIIDVATGRVARVEALVRWHRPGHGVVSPAVFMPVAADAGLARQVDEWVLRLACAEVAAWECPVPVSVNMSPAMFAQHGVVELVSTVLKDTGLMPHLLSIEITEDLLDRDIPYVREVLHVLRMLGIGVHLDDFGTEYSSLAKLKAFELDVLKIDQSFIREIDDPVSAAIVSSVITLAHGLGVRTTAEGVETVAQMETLRSMGCDTVQGFLFATAIPAREAEAFICGRNAATAAG
jgi:diguanylate cyclase (GGDEF)-like protein/PAS domain S-box-containing protein